MKKYSHDVLLSNLEAVIPYLVLTTASCPAYRFLRRWVRWSGIPISLWIFHSLLWSTQSTIKGYNIVNEAEVDVFMEVPCFFYDPVDCGNLISGSSAFSKCSLYIWKFSVHVLLKPSLKDFEHYLANMCNECNYMVVWRFFGIAILWDWNENWPLPVLWPLLVFQICWPNDCSALTVSSFRFWNNLARIPSLPLALFIVILPKDHFTSHYRMSGFRWPHHRGYSSH